MSKCPFKDCDFQSNNDDDKKAHLIEKHVAERVAWFKEHNFINNESNINYWAGWLIFMWV